MMHSKYARWQAIVNAKRQAMRITLSIQRTRIPNGLVVSSRAVTLGRTLAHVLLWSRTCRSLANDLSGAAYLVTLTDEDAYDEWHRYEPWHEKKNH